MDIDDSHVSNELVRSVDIPETRKTDLGDDSTKLAARRRNTVASRPVTSREHLTRDNEGCRVRSKVLEEVGKTVEEDEGLGGGGGRDQLVIAEAHAAEEYGENDKAHELDRLAAPAVDEEEGHPVTGDETCDGQDHITDANVLQVGVNLQGTSKALVGRTETDGVKNNGRVETKAVESDLYTKLASNVKETWAIHSRQEQTTSRRYQ